MDRKRGRFPGVIILMLCALAMLALAACDLGGDGNKDGTPGPNNPDGGPPSTQVVSRPLVGTVKDANTGQPISGVEVTAGGILTATNADGRYYFDDVPPNAKVEIVAVGYEATSVESGANGQMEVTLKPNSIGGRVTDASNGKPLARVLVRLDFPQPAPAQPVTGTETITGTPPVATPALTDSLRISGLAAPLRATSIATIQKPKPTIRNTIAPTATPVPPTLTVTPLPPRDPPTGEGFIATYTDENGEYRLPGAAPGSTLTFKMPGYKLTKAPADQPRKDIALEVFKAEAIYMTANIASVPSLRDELLDWAEDTRINSIVLNVQNDASEWSFEVKNKDVIEAGNAELLLPNLAEIVKGMRDRGFYVIARVVVFQQKTMAEKRPEWAVRSTAHPGPWRGGYNAHQKWLDASNPAAQDHIIEMTKEVLAFGFDEIQYDYVRFPSDAAPNEEGDMVFSRPLDNKTKPIALQGFLKKAYAVIEPTDAFLSIDVFGYAVWPDQNGEPYMGVIGQAIPELIPYTDYISPMIYPSHFVVGEQGCDVPAACAYELVKASGEFARPRFEGQRAKYRPWLQAFDWGKTDYTSKNSKRIPQQIKACDETDCWGWLMWDPANEYYPRSAFDK